MNQDHIRNFCIIAHIEQSMRHPFGVSHRAGKMEYILSGCSSRGEAHGPK